MSWIYKIALYTDVLGILIGFFFIISDTFKYPSTSKSGPLTLFVLAACAWVAISYYLYQHGNKAIGSIMAWIPAAPFLAYGLFILLFIILKPDMR